MGQMMWSTGGLPEREQFRAWADIASQGVHPVRFERGGDPSAPFSRDIRARTPGEARFLGMRPDGLRVLTQRAAALERVERYVERHLAEPDLAPERVARAVGLSLRQLHRVFEPTGTSFARHVLERRLAAARAELANPADAGRTVADIAFAWGFNNLVTFYRAFRRAYGAAPGEVRPARAPAGWCSASAAE
jgi:AraC-like DNA-binding protein